MIQTAATNAADLLTTYSLDQKKKKKRQQEAEETERRAAQEEALSDMFRRQQAGE